MYNVKKMSVIARNVFQRRSNLLTLGLIVLLSGCTVGPKYVRPATPVPAAYKESKDWKAAQPQDEIIRGGVVENIQ